LYTDKDIPIILGLDDVHESIATESTSASEIAIIQSEESQSTIPNLFICQEENTFEYTTVQQVDSLSNIVFDNLELQENNRNIQNISDK